MQPTGPLWWLWLAAHSRSATFVTLQPQRDTDLQGHTNPASAPGYQGHTRPAVPGSAAKIRAEFRSAARAWKAKKPRSEHRGAHLQIWRSGWGRLGKTLFGLRFRHIGSVVGWGGRRVTIVRGIVHQLQSGYCVIVTRSQHKWYLEAPQLELFISGIPGVTCWRIVGVGFVSLGGEHEALHEAYCLLWTISLVDFRDALVSVRRLTKVVKIAIKKRSESAVTFQHFVGAIFKELR